MPDLNQQIAMELGWHVEVNHYHGMDTYPDHYLLINPQGESTEWDDGCGMDEPSVQFDTEAQAWAHVPDFLEMLKSLQSKS